VNLSQCPDVSKYSFADGVHLTGLTTQQLQSLASEVREFLIDTICVTGGHIGANLGTIELTIAVDRVFGTDHGEVVWDTGHQGYTHKILTGRASRFATLNTYGGMNRFLDRHEDESDVIEASHAGTSVSIALGLALARKHAGSPGCAVAVFGDGALAEGLLLEALNHASVEAPLPLVLVLNDNGFAISPGFGALHEYLQSRNVNSADPETLFTSLGYRYHGPVEGHDVGALVDAFEQAKTGIGGPISIVHVKTEKGRGLPPAAGHPYRMHFSFPFDQETGKPLDTTAAKGYPDVAAAVIAENMRSDERIMCITPSTRYATGLDPIFTEFPDRCFDPGMEEQHAMTLAVGLALGGRIPVIAYQSTFMQRAYDQLFHDVCFMNVPALILSARVGFAGYDNPTHHGIYETSYVRSLPNLRVLYPKDGHELSRMVRDALQRLEGPTLIEMPYGPVDYIDEAVLQEPTESFAAPESVAQGGDLLLVSVGPRYRDAHEARERLVANGISAGLINLRYLKPLPEQALLDAFSSVDRVVVVEEAIMEGGVGSAIAALILDNGVDVELLRVGLPTVFVEPGSQVELASAYRLDADGIVDRIEERWPNRV